MDFDDSRSVDPYRSPEFEDPDAAEHLPPGDFVADMTVLELPDRKKEWRLSLHTDRLRLDPPGDDPPQDVMRSELPERVTVHETGMMKRSVWIKSGRKGRKATVFQLEPEDFATFTEWIGPPTMADLRVVLKRRFGWVLPIGILFVVTSLPIPGDPAAGIEPMPFHPVNFALGASLLIMGILAKRWPHPRYLLFDSLWFLALAGMLIYNMITGASWLWTILVLLQLSLVKSGLREHRRFTRAAAQGPLALNPTDIFPFQEPPESDRFG